jgi:regulator of replication initiation timing
LICLLELVVDLAEEVAKMQTENTRIAEECARLAVENTRLTEDHSRFRDHSVKMTKEVKNKNQEITSKWPLSRSWHNDCIDVLYMFSNQNALLQH